MTTPYYTPKKGSTYHTNQEPHSSGPCHIYWSRGGDHHIAHHILFRQSEMNYVEATPMGAIVQTHSGCEYRVTSPKPDQITGEAS